MTDPSAATSVEFQNESSDDYDLGPWPQIMDEEEAEIGGAFDGFAVSSDAEGGL